MVDATRSLDGGSLRYFLNAVSEPSTRSEQLSDVRMGAVQAKDL